MLKWHDSTDEPLRLPRFFIYAAAIIYLAALLTVAFCWHHWFYFVRQYGQTLFHWLQG